MNIAIYGAGGFGKEVACLVNRINAHGDGQWNLIGFFDDSKPVGMQVSSYGKVIGGIGTALHGAVVGAVKGTGINKKNVGRFFKGSGDAIKGIASGDLKWKDSTKFMKGSRDQQKKDKEGVAQKADNAMKSNISAISGKMDKMLKESEDNKRELQRMREQMEKQNSDKGKKD